MKIFLDYVFNQIKSCFKIQFNLNLNRNVINIAGQSGLLNLKGKEVNENDKQIISVIKLFAVLLKLKDII